jgi:hypothetical protein
VLVAVVAVLVAIGLASDERPDGGGQASAPETTEQRTTQKAEPKPKPPRRVALRVVPVAPTYVCVDRGPGTPVLFESTISDTQRFHGKRLRILLGKRDAELWMNGARVEVTPGANPVSYAFRPPRRVRELAIGEQPCT